jgi:uncharacterized protein YprB with RNaseH-like and TPR domain
MPCQTTSPTTGSTLPKAHSKLYNQLASKEELRAFKARRNRQAGHMLEAYLDIETTGLSPSHSRITVIGVHLTDGDRERLVQLVGDEVAGDSLLEVLRGVDVIYTYNGSGFDLPFIRASLGIDLSREFRHRDLMLDCWRRNLYGGFKAVEAQLGITRQLKGVDGREAIRLWWRYQNDLDRDALDTLLFYNREDVLNLRTLREMLEYMGT